MLVGVTRYAVEVYEHVYVNGEEKAVVVDHDRHVFRISSSADLKRVVVLVGRLAAAEAIRADGEMIRSG
jgi:hypothetical protein